MIFTIEKLWEEATTTKFKSRPALTSPEVVLSIPA